MTKNIKTKRRQVIDKQYGDVQSLMCPQSQTGRMVRASAEIVEIV